NGLEAEQRHLPALVGLRAERFVGQPLHGNAAGSMKVDTHGCSRKRWRATDIDVGKIREGWRGRPRGKDACLAPSRTRGKLQIDHAKDGAVRRSDANEADGHAAVPSPDAELELPLAVGAGAQRIALERNAAGSHEIDGDVGGG